MLKKIFFSIFVLWSLIDAVLPASDMPTFDLKLYGFFGSFALSMTFFAIVYLVWDWISRRITEELDHDEICRVQHPYACVSLR
jgi:hypothetical protein